MARLFLVTVCFALLLLGCFADVEHEEHGHGHHHHEHDGHDHHDHESHKNLFTGGTVDGGTQAQRKKLGQIAGEIDTDGDGKITRDEMRVYTAGRIKYQYLLEADELIQKIDPLYSGKVTFDGYVRENYGDLDVNKLEQMDKADTDTRETRRTYLAEKAKWEYLDKDGDKSLSHTEFQSFLRPEDDNELRKIEIDSIITEYDEDKDGKISNAEYLKMTEAETGQADTLSEELDKNKDGYGDSEEFANYYLPTSSSTTEEETDHLLKECDTDKSGFCTADEVVNAYSSFAGSQITDFGADLDRIKLEL